MQLVGHRCGYVVMDRHQIYIDPIFVKGNILRAYLLWDWKTRIEIQVEFLNHKLISMDRFRIIRFVTELMRRSNLDLIMTKDEFINIQFGEFPGLKVDIFEISF